MLAWICFIKMLGIRFQNQGWEAHISLPVIEALYLTGQKFQLRASSSPADSSQPLMSLLLPSVAFNISFLGVFWMLRWPGLRASTAVWQQIVSASVVRVVQRTRGRQFLSARPFTSGVPLAARRISASTWIMKFENKKIKSFNEVIVITSKF
jgi:hypothetical protein